MWLRKEDNRITVKPYARIPPLKVPPLADLPFVDLPPIMRGDPSDSNITITSQRVSANEEVDLSEGCLVTKSIKYTNQLTHWVHAVRNNDVVADAVVRAFMRSHS